ncbi:rhodanese-like domain-containing protein [Parenemella sanctibonifatiensis]|uniref:Rhodanese n=1 Tax=Parenemella sanctibonifatiensis TaxID=2016505 RepID=A0A255EG57_9ACTN|nr:rhodanese-like domain-containing protein [Parenemella sanctibonifatiensis]OYN88585.1 rhodanese [Parenemella sanctibonifatiensis]
MDASETTINDLPTDAVVLDVREDDEWAAGHAPTAVHIPLSQLPDRIAEIPQVDGELPVICRSGGRSARAAQFLAQQGIPATNVLGGMQGWQLTGRPLVGDSDAPTVI